MTTIARLGYGTTFTFPSFTGEVTSISFSGEKESLDVTHMASPNSSREFIAGLKDPGEMTVELNFDPAQTNPLELASGALSLTFPNGEVWAWDSAECTGFEAEVPVGEAMTGTATFKLSGELTQS